MWFTRYGAGWIHMWGDNPAQVKYLGVGYVSQRSVCGASIPMRLYSCALSQDLMYGTNLEWNTFYKGRVWNGNQPYFYLWPTKKGVLG
ncbi:hypothetical protein PRIPAC_75156 [Pristionchus pacificus]|uniref:Uncharacterized protein n=1 Tax=Pristionchus pacificus TaxID=54126 RepID=A0A2A6CS81_PRIPA|nr:hypothetical protein PRIPAC_75156 [Pristionchus pacificus]|eukprot:PDM81074.1 hypothetical protein PRIPAC_36077 [Pristionchus pacificus]